MTKPLTSYWTRYSGFTHSHPAARARALTWPPSRCCCRRLSRQVALPKISTVCLLREKCQPSPSRPTMGSVGNQSEPCKAEGQDELSDVSEHLHINLDQHRGGATHPLISPQQSPGEGS